MLENNLMRLEGKLAELSGSMDACSELVKLAMDEQQGMNSRGLSTENIAQLILTDWLNSKEPDSWSDIEVLQQQGGHGYRASAIAAGGSGRLGFTMRYDWEAELWKALAAIVMDEPANVMKQLGESICWIE